MITDFCFALRGFRQTPGLIAAAILTMALGAGVNTAIFSMLESTLLRTLPYREPGQLAVLWEANPKMEGFYAQRLPVAGRNFDEWRRRLHSFKEMEALRRSSESLIGMGKPENVAVARVTPGFFALFGRGAWLGRTFFSGSFGDRAAGKGVAVLSAEFFSHEFHGDVRALGRKLILGGASYAIVGVMPEDFHLPALWQGHEEMRPDVWLPVVDDLAPPIAGESRRNYVFGRLRDGVSMEQARRELSDLARRLEREYPRIDAGFGASVFPVAVEDVGPAMRRTVLAVEAAGIFILLIACVNVANLLLTRAAGRIRETAIRAALGASRARMVRAALAEGLLIGAAGGLIGVALARVAIGAIDSVAPESAYHLHELALNWRVLGAAFATMVLSAPLFGVAPALAASSGNLRHALSQDGRVGSGRATQRIRGALAAAETAFAVILLAGAGLMIRSMVNLLNVDLGFDAGHALTMRVPLPEARYRTTLEARAFCDRLLNSVSALPGVRSAAISTSLPLGDALSLAPYRVAGEADPRPGERTMADFKGVSEDYFRATGTPLLRGRGFTREDAASESPQVVIVNDALAREIAGRISLHRDPLGSMLVVGTGAKKIVGIVAGSHQMGLDSPVRPEMFLPTRAIAKMTLIVRTAGDPMAAAKAGTAAVWAIDPDQPVTNVRSMEDQLHLSVAQRGFDTALFAAFAALALFLAAVGLYGVLSHSVALRTREMGVRMALGAQPGSLKRLVLCGAMRLAMAGIAAGILGGLALTRLMNGLVFRVGTADPATFAATAAALLAVAALAAYVPGARASRLDPLVALRRD